jgi:phenylpyruvate tautomerase
MLDRIGRDLATRTIPISITPPPATEVLALMPTLRILTNVRVSPEDRPNLLARASRTVATMLHKPESYVLAIIEDQRDLLFGGSPDPAAYLELKSLGLAEARTPEYSKVLCDLLADTLNIPAGRIYIEFAAPPAHLFGWNGGTF